MEENETPTHPLSQFVPPSEPTDEEKAQWAEFDAILKDNRVGSSLRESAHAHHSVHFPYSGDGDPWAAGWGMFADDPQFDEWASAIQEYRTEREAQEPSVFAVSDRAGKEYEVWGASVG